MINNGGPSGFSNAPVSRTFFIASAAFTLLFRIRGRSNNLGLSYQDIFGKPHIWKYIVSIFAFSSLPELLFGLYLLYYFRMFERQLGSNKYSVFILFSIVSSSLLEVFYLATLRDTTASITSGAYGLIFSLFVQFYFDIPVSRRFNIFGIHFSDKSFVYLAGLQLLLSSWRRSFLPGICGVLAGALFRLNILHIRKLKFPVFITALFSRLYSPSSGASLSAPPRHAPSYMGRQVESSRTTMEPPEDSIATLVSMGFDRNNARQALLHARNDINAATNILLEAQSN